MVEQPYLGYAQARNLLLGDAEDTGEIAADDIEAARALLAAGVDTVPEHLELRQLGEAVLAIVDNRPGDALALLSDAHVTHTRLGRAEIPRLRTFAYQKLGDYASAYEAQREVTFMLSQAANQMYDLFIDDVTVRLDYDELLRNLTRYADEARTDPLTGLPNRLHLESHVADLLQVGGRAVIGVADLDRFKDVNTVHGHLVGDQVLQQVAAIMSRTLRAGDFLARFAGDEFVVVWPGISLAAAHGTAGRIRAAVAGHNWESFVPGTPVAVTIGVAELESGSSLTDAFHAADLLMLAAKRAKTGG